MIKGVSMKLPYWIKNPLKNEKINEIILVAAGLKKDESLTSGAVQILYEYIQKLEEDK